MESFRKHIFLSAALLFYLIATAVYISSKTSERRSELLAALDADLLQAAMQIPLLLPARFHHQGMNGGSVDRAADSENIRRLSDMVNTGELVYLYSLIEKHGRIHFTASSATAEEIATGAGLVNYYDEYDDAPPQLHEVFRSRQPAFVEYSDKWGSFRGVFLPRESEDGTLYVVAADADIGFVHDKTQGVVLDGVLASVFHLLVLLPFFFAHLLHYRQINRNLDDQVQERTRELQESNEKLNKLAITDFLTDIPNRRYFFMMAEKLLAVARREDKPASLLMLDVDHFKQVNDRYGHQAGDDVLVSVAEVVQRNLRRADLFGRVGGEEFAVLLSETDQAGAAVIAEKLRDAIETTTCQRGHDEIRVTVSVGYSEVKGEDEGLTELYARTDGLLYRAKGAGRNQVVGG